MLIPFSKLPDHARVWIYPSSREFTSVEIAEISQRLKKFLSQWATHGSPLETAYDLPYNRFIVIGLNESIQGASGCSIDASVRLIQQLETNYQVDLLDKMNVSYKEEKTIHYIPLKTFRKKAKSRIVHAKTIVFNNLVINKGEYRDLWEVPACESWHSRFIK